MGTVKGGYETRWEDTGLEGNLLNICNEIMESEAKTRGLSLYQ